MPIFNWTWDVVDMDDKEKEEVRLGRPHPCYPHDTFWFVGCREDGERAWVKSKNDAMTFTTKESAYSMWKVLGLEGIKIIDTVVVKAKH